MMSSITIQNQSNSKSSNVQPVMPLETTLCPARMDSISSSKTTELLSLSIGITGMN